MVGLPENVVEAEKSNLDATCEPGAEGIACHGVDVPGGGVELVPVNHREGEVEWNDRSRGSGEKIRDCGAAEVCTVVGGILPNPCDQNGWLGCGVPV